MNPIPSVSGTKIQWYIADIANCNRDQSISALSNIVGKNNAYILLLYYII